MNAYTLQHTSAVAINALPLRKTWFARQLTCHSASFLIVGMLLMLMGLMPNTARADGCYYTGAFGKWTATVPPPSNNGSTVTFGAVDMSIDSATTTGQYPGSGNPAPTTGFTKVLNLHCDADTKARLVNLNGAGPINTAGTLFPTEIQNIGYMIKADGASIPAAGYASFTWSNQVSSYSLPYHITALYPSYYQLSANTPLAELHVKLCTNAVVNAGGKYVSCNAYTDTAVQSFIAGSLSIHSRGCVIAVNNKDISVTLPTIATQDLVGTGTTLGKTKFTIHLVGCFPDTQVHLSLDSAAKAGLAGVINPTTGTGHAQNVGVQLLRADGTTAVVFGADVNHSFPEGPTTTGPHGTSGPSMSIDFFAQYYQLGNTVSSGVVNANATFTVSYY